MAEQYRNEEDEIKIFQQYNKTKESLLEDIEIIQKWVTTQPHLPEVPVQVIKNFLLFSKCSIEVTKQNIDWYYSLRSMIPELFDGMDPREPHMRRVSEAIYCLGFPKLTPNLCRLVIIKSRNLDIFKTLSTEQVIAYLVSIFELSLRASLQWKFVSIVDLQDIAGEITKRFNPIFCKNALTALTKMHGFPVAAVFIINAPPIINTIFTFIKSLLKPKIVKRIHFCNDLKEVKEYIPADYLPLQYGGNLESLEKMRETFLEVLALYEDIFDDPEKLKANESLRPPESRINLDWGCSGNFRKLEID